MPLLETPRVRASAVFMALLIAGIVLLNIFLA